MSDQADLRQSIGESIKIVAGTIKGSDGLALLLGCVCMSAVVWSSRPNLAVTATLYIMGAAVLIRAISLINDIMRLRYGLRREEEERRK